MTQRFRLSLVIPTLITLSTVFSVPTAIAQQRIDCDSNEIFSVAACPGDSLDAEEQKLFNLINDYRLQNGLPAIPLSPSLSLVANRHVRDMAENINGLTHNWSDCPSNTWSCMWEAPQRLGTPYPGNGYENAYRSSLQASAASALRSWRSDKPHREVILNQGIWDEPWNAMGVGIYEGYAVMWVGREVDPATPGSR
ncbi:MAG: CAP domain-containing protein [Cyanobacteria bacterium P01_B01_bin.77]